MARVRSDWVKSTGTLPPLSSQNWVHEREHEQEGTDSGFCPVLQGRETPCGERIQLIFAEDVKRHSAFLEDCALRVAQRHDRVSKRLERQPRDVGEEATGKDASADRDEAQVTNRMASVLVNVQERPQHVAVHGRELGAC